MPTKSTSAAQPAHRVRPRAATPLQESEARMAAILLTAVDAIISIDERGTIGAVNPAAERMFGYNADEMIGRNVKMLMPEPYRHEHDGYLAEYVHTGIRKIIGIGREVTGLRKDGSTFPMDLAVSEVLLGTRRTFTGIVRDITERKEFEARLLAQANELRQRNEDLLRSNQDLDAFVYIASHDLKEPLRGIHNYATFLIEDYVDRLDEEGRARLETLRRLSQRLGGLLDSLLEVSRIGRVDLRHHEVDLDATLRDVLDALQISLDERRVTVRVPHKLPTVRGDRTLLGEVLNNLITNAMKYNDKAERWIEIGVAPAAAPPAEAQGVHGLPAGSTTLYVRDNGIGISPGHRSAVFALFKRLHARDAYGGGTGVGLALTRKIVERHGGAVWVESTPGEGSTFYVSLPP